MELKSAFEATEFGQFPDHWTTAPLEVLSEFITSGSRGWARFYSERGATFIRSQNVRKGTLDFQDHQCVIPPQGAEGSRTKVLVGDVLITITGNSVGNVASVDQDLGEAYISQHVGLVRLKEPSFARYVSMFLSPGAPGNEQITSSQSGQSKPGLNLRNLEEFWIALPPDDEREAIVTALSDVDALIAGLDQLIAKKRDLKQAAMQQLLTGQTRLPGFSGAWEVKRLGDVGHCLRGVSYRGDADLYPYDTAQSKRLLRSNNVQEAVIVTTDIQFVDAACVAERQILQAGDVLICMANGSKALVGKAAYFDIDDGHEYTFGAFMGAFRVIHELADRSFSFYLFQTNQYRNYINNLLAGSSINNLTPSNVESLEFLFPSLREQTAIAAVLSDMDAELAALEARLAKTRALKTGMMQELLTGRTRLV
ncbi:restriction endonuclease subunit S [Chromobacterium violaceum]|uniref:restriction endonuclease subunit S n=1 Tax=Chromobacterium violaceum TaxID=536 RepID=UPI0009B83031|nr:restriction endonuclease subunit S [Chromobacterium violaceum]